MIESLYSGIAGAIVVCYLLWMLAQSYRVAMSGFSRKFMVFMMAGLALRIPAHWWTRFCAWLRWWAHEMVDRA